MKFIVLIIIILGLFHDDLQDYSLSNNNSAIIRSCPSGQTSDIFIIMQLLMSTDLAAKRRLLDLPEIDAKGIESVPMEGDVSKHLHTFWSKRGVDKVAEATLCNRLNEIAVNRGLMEQDSYHLAFYEINGKYLLLHLTNRVSDKRAKTAISLSSNYSIVGVIEF